MSDDFLQDSPDNPDFERFLEPDHLSVLRVLPVAIAVALAVVTVLGMVLLRPTGAERPDLDEIGITAEVHGATVVAVTEERCAVGLPCQQVSFRLDQGPDAGGVVELEFVIAETSPYFTIGDRVVLDYRADAEPGFEYGYADRQRRPVLAWVAIIFALAVVALGRLRGLAALVGLAASIFVLLQFVIPAILDGRSPVLVAAFGAAAIAYVALYAAHGFNRMTTVALLGTLAALVVTVLLSEIAIGAADLTGFASDEAFILTIVGTIDLSGLVLAGVVLGSMGAIDDVTVTQASAVWEVKRAKPEISRIELVRAGLRVGRDHVASTVNTLLLAYAGASMPLLIFFVLSDQSLGTVLNSEIVATEVLRTLVGSIGLVASVPLTTWLAAVMAHDVGVEPHGHG
ncbi:MAG TPA: YibE/F family protein [Acidimicrobiia bacterium]|nr:YibE/F family protein [Acidimicrobiia bacterium]